MDPADQPHRTDPGARRADVAQPVRNQDGRPLSHLDASGATPGARRFPFVQLQFPFPLGPPDGRYPVRLEGLAADERPAWVLVLETVGAQKPPRFGRRRRDAGDAPQIPQVPAAQVTIVMAQDALQSADDARRWLATAEDEIVDDAIVTLNRLMRAFRIAAADPYARPLRRGDAIEVRIGHGTGDQVVEGRWTEARDLLPAWERQRRAAALVSQNRLSAVLNARQPPLVCEELALRARMDLDQDQARAAALSLLTALDAALAELSVVEEAEQVQARVEELRTRREAVIAAAQDALTGEPDADAQKTVTETLGRLEAALRARALLA